MQTSSAWQAYRPKKSFTGSTRRLLALTVVVCLTTIRRSFTQMRGYLCQKKLMPVWLSSIQTSSPIAGLQKLTSTCLSTSIYWWIRSSTHCSGRQSFSRCSTSSSSSISWSLVTPLKSPSSQRKKKASRTMHSSWTKKTKNWSKCSFRRCKMPKSHMNKNKRLMKSLTRLKSWNLQFKSCAKMLKWVKNRGMLSWQRKVIWVGRLRSWEGVYRPLKSLKWQ